MFERDYTGVMYDKLIAAVSKHYKTYSILDYYEAKVHGRLKDRLMIMRHDVDADASNALAMAKIDAAHGIRSTFYFRMKRHIFKPMIVKQIQMLGHEIGYHYEVLSDTKGDFKKAGKLFARHLHMFRKIVPVRTACMHGRSLSKINNLDFFKHYRLQSFGLVAEPYLSIDYSDKYYLSDTGLCWDNQRFNIRDIVHSKGNGGVSNTKDLIRFISSPTPQKAALLTHTNNWVNNLFLWSSYKFSFLLLNNFKKIIKNFK
jgi:hypothetical protein